jgi:hypothetical protein
VVLVRDRVEPGKWDQAAEAPVTGLGIGRREVANAVIFDVRPKA